MDLRLLLCSTAPTASITSTPRSVNVLQTTSDHPSSQLPPPPTSVPIRQEPIGRVAFSQNENLDSIGTSTWQSRNPTTTVLLPRHRAGRHKSDAEKTSLAARSFKRKEKATALDEAIQGIIANRDDAIQELAILHSVSVNSLAKRVNATSNYHPTRGPNMFNALVSMSSVELNEGKLSSAAASSHCDLLMIAKVVRKGTA